MDIICTDFDGTIFTEFAMPPIPDAFERIISEYQEQGGRWLINTGRDMSSLMESLGRSNLKIRPDWLVVVEREIYRREGHEYVPHQPWNDRCEAEHAALWEREKDRLHEIRKWIDTHFDATLYGDDWSPLSIIADSNEALNEIQLKVEEMCSDAGDLDFVRNDVYARFASKSYNKGSALEEVSKTLGVPAGAIFAAGDHWNDLPMLDLRYAGNIACPANAIPAVKKRVKSQEGYQSDEYEGNGTVEAIIHFEPELATILES